MYRQQIDLANRSERDAHAGSRTRVTSMGGLYDTVTLHAREDAYLFFATQI